MMDEREIMALVRDHLPHAYLNSPNAACRLARAIRNAALEEAAKICDEWQRENVLEECCDRAQDAALRSISKCVRALKTKEGE